MSRIRIVKMRFDLNDKYDAATYQGLAESGRRAFCQNRGRQAHYLASLMLGTRPYSGLEQTGLAEIPKFSREIDEQLSHLQARAQDLEGRMASLLFRNQIRAPVLRLVPTKNSNGARHCAHVLPEGADSDRAVPRS